MSPWVPQDDGPAKVVGPRSENHHWWPQGLSKFWKGKDGKVGSVRLDDNRTAQTFRSHHKKLGGQRDGHSQIYGGDRNASPWNRSDESIFDEVDTQMPEMVNRLRAMAGQSADRPNMEWQPVADDPVLRDILAPALASLCLRNPHSRYLASSLGRNLMGYERGSEVDKNVSLGNMLGAFRSYEKHVRGRGRFGLFVAQEGEFIYGDGCYHNMPVSADVGHNTAMLVPMTPRVAVGYRLPTSYMTEPMFCVMNVDAVGVSRLNELVQVYSERQLFFSNIEPELSEHFMQLEFRRIQPRGNIGLYWLNQMPGLS